MIDKQYPAYANCAYAENYLQSLAIDNCSGKTAYMLRGKAL